MNYEEMTYEEIVDVIEKLLLIDSDNLDTEAIRNQKIFPEINRIYIQKSRRLTKLSEQQSKVEFNRYRHYAGKLTAAHYKEEPLMESILKTDIPKYMDIDAIVVEIRGLVGECEKTVKFIEDAKGSLRSRGFDIKNAIEWRRLMMGN